MRQRLNAIRAYIAELDCSDSADSLSAELHLLDALPRLRRSRPLAADLLIAATAHPNPTVRFRAVRALASTRLKRAYPAIVALVSDPDGDVRYDAVMALGRFGYREAIPLLVERVRQGERDDYADSAAAESLARLGPTSLEPVTELLRCECAKARSMAASVLGSLRDSRAIEVLDGLSQDSDAGVRVARIEALEKLALTLPVPEARRCLSLIAFGLDDPDERVRDSSRHSLEWVREHRPAVT